MSFIFNSIDTFLDGSLTKYIQDTTSKVKLIDIFIGFFIVTAIIQVVYCFLVGTYPFNAFLSGFYVSIGSAVLTGIPTLLNSSDRFPH